MNRLYLSLLALVFAVITSSSSAVASSVGDCVAMYFYKQGCPQCQAMQRPIEQLIESGWAVRNRRELRTGNSSALACSSLPDRRPSTK